MKHFKTLLRFFVGNILLGRNRAADRPKNYRSRVVHEFERHPGRRPKFHRVGSHGGKNGRQSSIRSGSRGGDRVLPSSDE